MESEANREQVSPIQPERIVVDWRRLACGLWRLAEGDISAAYCADIFPKLKVFTHGARLYTNCGNCFSSAIHATATCYPLIPPNEYHGLVSVRYSYEGKEGQHKGKTFRLGPKTLFESSDPSVSDWTQLIRVMYADGGYFASSKTYFEFLSKRNLPKTENEQIAYDAELELCRVAEMPRTQGEMKEFLPGADSSEPFRSNRQLEFCL